MAETGKVKRRDFFKILGATGALTATGCTDPLPETRRPYLSQPDAVIPGSSVYYAGTCGECSAGCGIAARVIDGRVIKVEGLRAHPINKGGLCAHGQSTLQHLYDPDRLRGPLVRAVGKPFEPRGWVDDTSGKKGAIGEFAQAITSRAAGKEVVVLTPRLTGSIKALIGEFVRSVPAARHVEFSTHNFDYLDIAAEACFGEGSRFAFDMSPARAVLSVGADFLESWLSPVELSRQWADSRRGTDVNFVMHVEPRLSLTGANADVWFKNAPSTGVPVLAAVFRALSSRDEVMQRVPDGLRARLRAFADGIDIAETLNGSGLKAEDIDRIASRLIAAPVSLVLAGGPSLSGEDPVLGAILATLCNLLLGNIGKTVFVHRDRGKARSGYEDMVRLIEDMKADKVGVLVVTGVNPAYSLPEAAGFAKAITKVPTVVSISAHMDETTALAQIVLPQSTSFERWDDSEPAPGLWNLNQPAMQPLYKDGSQGFGDTLLAVLKALGKPVADVSTFYDYIRAQWKTRTGEAGFEDRWTTYVERGGDWSADGRLPRPDAAPNLTLGALRTDDLKVKQAGGEGLKLMVFPTVNSFDGSAANRAWMQELPNPITTAVWGSWVEMHPDVAAREKLKTGDVVQVVRKMADGSSRAVEAPVYVTKFIHPGLVAIPLGQGHEGYGRYAKGIGVNALTLLSPEGRSQSLLASDVELRRAATKVELVRVQGEDSQHGRGLIREVSITAFAENGELIDLDKPRSAASENHAGGEGAHHEGAHSPHGESGDDRFPGVTKHGHGDSFGPQPLPKQMYAQMEHPVYRWGMSIDLNACSGCSACVVACYAENNVAVVGRDMVSRGRHMAWINIQRYFDENSDERPIAGFFPMLCQHCSNAPCEPVCPVYATYHNEEGLNSMVYNRCVGTRYCLNNCSYQVRRFNWFRFWWPEPLTWQLNPNVTVREVGVMEKCSFCVQRIREAQHVAKDLGRPVQDGDVVPACASSCPTDAIKFGNLLDKKSKVSVESQSSRGYKILDAALNTQPAITYLARVRPA